MFVSDCLYLFFVYPSISSICIQSRIFSFNLIFAFNLKYLHFIIMFVSDCLYLNLGTFSNSLFGNQLIRIQQQCIGTRYRPWHRVGLASGTQFQPYHQVGSVLFTRCHRYHQMVSLKSDKTTILPRILPDTILTIASVLVSVNISIGYHQYRLPSVSVTIGIGYIGVGYHWYRLSWVLVTKGT